MKASAVRMAGRALRKDPAIERWADFRAQQHRAFKWTPKVTLYGLIFGVLFPYSLYCVGYYTKGLIDFTGKLQGEPVMRDDLFWQVERRDRRAREERYKKE